MPSLFFNQVYDIVRKIPSGQVATYGQVAAVIGPDIAARDVGDAMAALRHHPADPPVPWQRVLNAQGRVSTGARQQKLLQEEGVIFSAKGQTDLHRFGWPGPDPAWAEAHGFHTLPPLKPAGEQLDLF